MSSIPTVEIYTLQCHVAIDRSSASNVMPSSSEPEWVLPVCSKVPTESQAFTIQQPLSAHGCSCAYRPFTKIRVFF
eukprot:gene8197-biopygen21131